jgi:transcriptional regulator GlxA family with amidase domain
LLVQTRLPVVQIAAQTGFNSPQYLNHVFHKATGVTPRKYRLASTENKPARPRAR